MIIAFLFSTTHTNGSNEICLATPTVSRLYRSDTMEKRLRLDPEMGLATWNPYTGALKTMRRANSSRIAAVKYTSGGLIITAGWDDAIRLWDDLACANSCVLAQTSKFPQSLAISFDDHWIAVGDTDNTVTVWRLDVPNRKLDLDPSLTVPDPGTDDSDHVRGVAFDTLGHLAAVNFSGGLVVQELTGWKTVFEQHTGLRLDGVAFAPDGSRVFVAGVEGATSGRLLAFNAKDGSRIQLFETPANLVANGGNPFRSVAISPDGRWLIAGGTYLLKWNLATGAPPTFLAETVRVPVGSILSPYADSIIIPLQTVHVFSLLHSHFATLPPSDQAITTFALGQTSMSADGRFIATPGLSSVFKQFLSDNCGTVLSPDFSRCTQSLLGRKDLPGVFALMLFSGSDLTYVGEAESDTNLDSNVIVSHTHSTKSVHVIRNVIAWIRFADGHRESSILEKLHDEIHRSKMFPLSPPGAKVMRGNTGVTRPAQRALTTRQGQPFRPFDIHLEKVDTADGIPCA